MNLKILCAVTALFFFMFLHAEKDPPFKLKVEFHKSNKAKKKKEWQKSFFKNNYEKLVEKEENEELPEDELNDEDQLPGTENDDADSEKEDSEKVQQSPPEKKVRRVKPVYKRNDPVQQRNVETVTDVFQEDEEEDISVEIENTGVIPEEVPEESFEEIDDAQDLYPESEDEKETPDEDLKEPEMKEEQVETENAPDENEEESPDEDIDTSEHDELIRKRRKMRLRLIKEKDSGSYQ